VSDLDDALARLDDEVMRRRVRHVVTENQRVLSVVDLLRDGEIRSIGPLLTASHASMRDDFEITVPEVDTAVEAALAAGAYGARMTGGGFGGCVLALVEASATDAVAAAVADAFGSRGFAAPAPFVATPHPGATRLA
jgi:galactokinase